ncbi:MAG TPA: two-component regulator propeller domain-containing protein [Verrucomicrobiae bacterium]|nr:two-component regulator propeller domain-containing protein [Verrucomicrobiae bacterium]
MFTRPRFFCATFGIIYLMLVAGLAQAAEVMDGENTNPPAGLWLNRTWQTDEGLPDNNVTGVAQAADGHLWVATLGGLMRFDGERFDEFSMIHLPKVPNRVVLTMYLDRRAQLWLVMDRGVVIRVSDKAAHVFDEADGFGYIRGTAMAEDSEGGMWFVSGSDVCRILNDKVERFGLKEGLPTGGHICLATDGQGQLWFACGAHVGIYRAGHWQTLVTVDSSPVHLVAARAGGMWICTATQVIKCNEGGESENLGKLPPHVSVQAMLEDHAGALWIGTAADGLFRLNGDELEHVAVSQPEITSLTEDREGNLWVGTAGGGLNRLRPRAIDLIGTKAGLPFESVRSVCVDTEGWVWTALQNGSLARGRGGEWQAMSSADGWPGGNVSCVTPGRDGGIWIGTHDRGLQRWQAGKAQEWGQRQGLSSQNVRSLLQASNGDMWIATDTPSRMWLFRDGKFQELSLPPKVRGIRTLAEGVDGTIWAGTSDGQILHAQGHAMVNEVNAQKGPPYSIRCLLTTADGSLWIGYAGWGIGRWHGGNYSRVASTQGLYDDYVSQMVSDGQGGLWMAGNHGLSQVRLNELVDVCEGHSTHLRSNVYGRGEGLPSLQPVYENCPTAWRGNDGQLWLATRRGVLMVQPDRIRENPIPPAVFVQEVKMDDHPVALYESRSPLRTPEQSTLTDLHTPGELLQLPPRHTKVEFEFTALSFNSPENVQFRYRLKGFDTEWIEAGTQRSAKYPRLPAGSYEFEVTACNEAGVWNETGFHLPIVVRPFFWQSWWFRTLLVVAFTAAIIAMVRYVSFRRLRQRMQHLEQQAVLDKERARIAKDLHDDLGASMTRMTLVLELALQQRREPEAVIGTVQDGLVAAREAIKSLDAAVWAVNPANNTLPELVAYIGQFGMEFLQQANIRCLLDLPDHPPERSVSAELRHNLFLIVKEALNNVVRHAHASEVRLQILITPAALDLLIADNGRGIERKPDDALADGLRNMRQRAEELGAQFQIDSAPGAGTKISVHYPWPSVD